MLMDIKCSIVTSVAVALKFDNGRKKHAIISVGDLIDVEYLKNGLIKRIQGKVLSITTNTPDPRNWSIIVDGSGDFVSTTDRFSPANIRDIRIIRKMDQSKLVETPKDASGIAGLRVVKGELQYTKDGYTWYFVKSHNFNPEPDIKDEEGTTPSPGPIDPDKKPPVEGEGDPVEPDDNTGDIGDAEVPDVDDEDRDNSDPSDNKPIDGSETDDGIHGTRNMSYYGSIMDETY